MLPFSSADYREAIKALMEQRRRFDERATFQDLAQAIRVPKSYVSKVLLGKANFSSDQIFLVCKYFELSRDKGRYLELLLEHERCGVEDRKKLISAEILEIQNASLQTPPNIDALVVDEKQKTLEEYYLDPFNCIVHMSLMIDRIAKSPQKLLAELGISKSTLDHSIKTLVRLGLVDFEKSGATVKSDTIHLPKNSLTFKAWNAQVRLLSQHRLLHIESERSYSLSVTFTAKEGDRQKIQGRFIEFLKEVEKISQQKNTEQVLQMNFDLFPWLFPT